jgi:hypothetical protein
MGEQDYSFALRGAARAYHYWMSVGGRFFEEKVAEIVCSKNQSFAFLFLQRKDGFWKTSLRRIDIRNKKKRAIHLVPLPEGLVLFMCFSSYADGKSLSKELRGRGVKVKLVSELASAELSLQTLFSDATWRVCERLFSVWQEEQRKRGLPEDLSIEEYLRRASFDVDFGWLPEQGLPRMS